MAMTRGSKVVRERAPVPKVKRWSRPTLTRTVSRYGTRMVTRIVSTSCRYHAMAE